MATFPAQQFVLLDPSGAITSSATTSNAFLVADFAQMALSVLTVTTFASLITVQACNADGLKSAIPDGMWSTITTLTSPGVFTVDPGFKWLRVASASSATVILSARVRG